MEFDNTFDVPLAPDQAWRVLMDIPRIAPCMPGAELTEVVDARNYKGKISVRLGPVALAFAGRVELDAIDDANRSARVKAQGSDAKGRGAANATASFRIEPAGAGSKVLIHTDLMLSGAVAQYGRGVGMIQATAAQIISQFAGNLRAQLAREGAPPPAATAPPVAAAAPATQAPPPAAPPPLTSAPPLQPEQTPRPAALPSSSAPPPPSPAAPAKPISGLTLIARVIWQAIVMRFTGRRT
jgi:carbon monoxide dehydrogenase subunit G